MQPRWRLIALKTEVRIAKASVNMASGKPQSQQRKDLAVREPYVPFTWQSGHLSSYCFSADEETDKVT